MDDLANKLKAEENAREVEIEIEPDLQKLNQRLYKSSVVILGWWKLASVLVYIMLLHYTIHPQYLTYSRIMMAILRLLLLVAIVGTLIYAALLLYGGFLEEMEGLEGAVKMCIALAGLDLLLGLLGFSTYLIGIYYTVNFVILVTYIFILVQLLWTLCYDLPQIIIYKQLIGLEQEEMNNMIAEMTQTDRELLRGIAKMQHEEKEAADKEKQEKHRNPHLKLLESYDKPPQKAIKKFERPAPVLGVPQQKKSTMPPLKQSDLQPLQGKQATSAKPVPQMPHRTTPHPKQDTHVLPVPPRGQALSGKAGAAAQKPGEEGTPDAESAKKQMMQGLESPLSSTTTDTSTDKDEEPCELCSTEPKSRDNIF